MENNYLNKEKNQKNEFVKVNDQMQVKQQVQLNDQMQLNKTAQNNYINNNSVSNIKNIKIEKAPLIEKEKYSLNNISLKDKTGIIYKKNIGKLQELDENTKSEICFSRLGIFCGQKGLYEEPSVFRRKKSIVKVKGEFGDHWNDYSELERKKNVYYGDGVIEKLQNMRIIDSIMGISGEYRREHLKVKTTEDKKTRRIIITDICGVGNYIKNIERVKFEPIYRVFNIKSLENIKKLKKFDKDLLLGDIMNPNKKMQIEENLNSILEYFDRDSAKIIKDSYAHIGMDNSIPGQDMESDNEKFDYVNKKFINY